MGAAQLTTREKLRAMLREGDDLVVGAVTRNGDVVHDTMGADTTVYPRPFDDSKRQAVIPCCVVRCSSQSYLRARRIVASYLKINSSQHSPEPHAYTPNRLLDNLSDADRALHRQTLVEGLRDYCASLNGGLGSAARMDVKLPRECIMDYLESVSLSAETPEALQRRLRGSRLQTVGCPCIMAECQAKGRSYGDDFACRTCINERYLPLCRAADVLVSLAMQAPNRVPDLRAFFTHDAVTFVPMGEAVAQFIDECVSITFGRKFSAFNEWTYHCLVQACCAILEASEGDAADMQRPLPVLTPLAESERALKAADALLRLPGDTSPQRSTSASGTMSRSLSEPSTGTPILVSSPPRPAEPVKMPPPPPRTPPAAGKPIEASISPLRAALASWMPKELPTPPRPAEPAALPTPSEAPVEEDTPCDIRGQLSNIGLLNVKIQVDTNSFLDLLRAGPGGDLVGAAASLRPDGSMWTGAQQ